MKAKEKIQITPHPDKVLIKVTKANWNSLFSKYVTVKGGKRVELFTDIQEDDGFDRRYRQNVSVGVVVAIGENINGILPGDMAIIDYSVTGNDDALVGFVNGDRLVSIDAVTTYHTEDSTPQMNGRFAYVQGDPDILSKLLGVVRMGKLIAFSPYIFLKHENANKLKVSGKGVMFEEKEEFSKREVLAAGKGSIATEGSKVLIKETDLFSRVIDGKEISVVFESDLLVVL